MTAAETYRPECCVPAAGYDAITFNAVKLATFAPLIRRAKRSGTGIVALGRALGTSKILHIDESQMELDRPKAQAVVCALNGTAEKILMGDGLPGNATDRDRRAA
ncbi:type 1 periplasmic-binding domain-containing protein [Tateyamaria pelophila]|uniref:hypothetical protein n=1 Tax=Tateyamaria pelophila TaxID=328415 RepID=UPI001CBDAEC1|nr:hypothetical protein [Tateyamaria pelophila]